MNEVAAETAEQSPICTCCTCGYQWERGTNGSHSCTTRLLERIAALEAIPKPFLFFEIEDRASCEAQEQCRKSLNKVFGDQYKPVALSSSLKLVNQQAWKPARLDIECGHISIKSPGTGRGTVITVDGQEMRNVRRIAFELTPQNAALVNIEFAVKPATDA